MRTGLSTPGREGVRSPEISSSVSNFGYGISLLIGRLLLHNQPPSGNPHRPECSQQCLTQDYHFGHHHMCGTSHGRVSFLPSVSAYSSPSKSAGFTFDILSISACVNPCLRIPSKNNCSPSGCNGFPGCPISDDRMQCSTPIARIAFA